MSVGLDVGCMVKVAHTTIFPPPLSVFFLTVCVFEIVIDFFFFFCTFEYGRELSLSHVGPLGGSWWLLSDRQTDGQSDGRTLGRTAERTDNRTDGQGSDGRTVSRMDGRAIGRTVVVFGHFGFLGGFSPGSYTHPTLPTNHRVQRTLARALANKHM